MQSGRRGSKEYPAAVGNTNEVLTIAKRVRACRACSLRRACGGPIPGVGRAGAAVMVVDQSPNWIDNGDQAAYTGSGGQLVIGALARHGFPASKTYLTYLVHCFPNKARGPQGGPPAYALAQCKDYLRQEYEAVQPKLIIALGAAVMKHFGIKGGIKQNNGRIFHTAWGPVMPLLSPGGLMKRMNETPLFVTQMASAATFINGGTIPPPYSEPEDWA